MAKITQRANFRDKFGETLIPSSDVRKIAVYGTSKSGGVAVTTPASVKSNPAYKQGFQTSTEAGKENTILAYGADLVGVYYGIDCCFANIEEDGILEWDINAKYTIGSIAKDPINFKLYKALTGTDIAPNVGLNPSTNPSDWEVYYDKAAFVTRDGTQGLLANLDANNFLINNLAPAVAPSDAVRFDQLSQIVKPYSVISAARDINGYADFIFKVNNNTIGFNFSEPIKICYSADDIEILTSSADLADSVLAADGNYIIIKEKGNSTPQLRSSSDVVESIKAPTAPVAGMYWLDISVTPYQYYKWNGATSAWISQKFCKLGEYTRSSGIIGTPISYALNGFSLHEKTTPYNAFTVNANLGTLNYTTTAELECIAAASGFTVGARYPVLNHKVIGGVSDYYAIPIVKYRNEIFCGAENTYSVTNNIGLYDNLINDSRFKMIITATRTF